MDLLADCCLPPSRYPTGATSHCSTPSTSPLTPPLPLPSHRRSFGSSAPPLTCPLPCWQAKSRSSLQKSMALSPLPGQLLLRNPLPNLPLSHVPSLPLPLLPPLPPTLHPLLCLCGEDSCA